MGESLPSNQESIPARTPEFRLGENIPSKQIGLDAELPIRQAFDENPGKGIALLFQMYYPQLCSHVLRFVSSKAIAEDLVSDIFYEFHSQGLYRSVQTSFRAYLFASIRHRAFDYVRTEMKRQTSLENAAAVSVNDAQNPDSITQYEDLYHDVQIAINSMPHKRRQIYLMNRFEGKKSHEIADELDLSARTVEAHLYQAFRQLRDALRDKWLILAVLFIY